MVGMKGSPGTYESLFSQYKTKVDELAHALKSQSAFDSTLHHFQAAFLHQRQAPQEIIEPNEVEEEEEEGDVKKAGLLEEEEGADFQGACESEALVDVADIEGEKKP
jgi:hypothetical protein